MTISTHGAARVTFLDGRGDLPLIEVNTAWSEAEIYLHGATVTHYQKHGERPLLFVSQCSRFEKGVPIRGGIPVIFPWFGKPANKPGQHGLVRQADWELREVASPPDGSVSLRFHLPGIGDSALCPGCSVEYVIGVGDKLTAELNVTNNSSREVTFENCLHTYFAVGDITSVRIAGLKGLEHLDAVKDFAANTEMADAIVVDHEVDRVYLNSPHTVQIRDANWRRVIVVEKENAKSSVVWNPWIEKSKRMQDYGDEEYREMICVESGNVHSNAVKLAAGAASSLKVKYSTLGLT